MPGKGFLGDALPLGSVGSRQVRSNPATKWGVPPIQIRRWVRNGSHPNAEYENLKNESLNQAGLFRTKDYFQFVSPGMSYPGSLGSDEDLWRAAFRTGPLTHAMLVNVVMGVPRATGSGTNSYALLNLYTVTDESVVATFDTFNYGNSPKANVNIREWKYVRSFDKMITVTPNTDYYALVRSMEYARVHSICAIELASFTENFSGYLPQNLGVHQPILDVYREKQSSLLKQEWEGYGPKVFNWSAFKGNWSKGAGVAPNFDWKQTTSTTGTNVLDYAFTGAGVLGSSSVSASTPGWHPDMQNKNRASQTSGVPCAMKAFGKYTQGASVNPTGGVVELKDSTGAVVASITGWGSTAEWRSVTFDLPASDAKYDVHFRNAAASETFDLWAVSIYEDG